MYIYIYICICIGRLQDRREGGAAPALQETGELADYAQSEI